MKWSAYMQLERVRALFKSKKTMMVLFFLGGVGVLFFFAIDAAKQAFVAPGTLQEPVLVTVPEGASLLEAVRRMEQHGIIASANFVTWIILLRGGEFQIKAGDYYFDSTLSATQAARRLLTGDFGLQPIRITIPEGLTTYQMADLFAKHLWRFDKVTFLERTKHMEGYLFPDTYFFLPNVTIETIVDTMQDTLYVRLAELKEEIRASSFTLHELLTIASLLEREADTYEAKQIIAGILYRRLDAGMPLQVDAVFGYIYGRETFHPRYSHLEIDSPYNTYKYTGLPPGPIANPGIESIRAALNPIKTNYLFYLTGRDGNMYYSATYTEHLRYKETHLH